MNQKVQNIFSKVQKLNELRKRKTIVFMMSAMRSGSTLLKSLLANAPDTSHLPEIDFQKYAKQNTWKLKTLSTSKILILKKPAPLDTNAYPILPQVQDARYIVLVRDVYETVESMKTMIAKVYPDLEKDWPYERLVNDYWCSTYRNILNKVSLQNPNTSLVRYEDVVANPVKETERLFQFIGSRQTHGVREYFPPEDFQWKWGSDDGGEKLKTLEIKASPRNHSNQRLKDIINTSSEVSKLRAIFYPQTDD